MARVTVEDCLEEIENPFHLVLIAAKRARHLSFGTFEALIPWENHKPTVLALKEIAERGLSAIREQEKPRDSDA